MSLSEFLLARIAEDEATARAAIAPDAMHPWGDRKLPQMSVESWPENVRGYLGGPLGEHCAQHNPTRVLADCEAKRRIIYGCTRELENWVVVRPGVRENRPVRAPWTEDDTAQDVLTYMALPYATHPDYRSEWAP